MTDLLPPLPLLLAFTLASFVLAVTPGPGLFYILARSVQGRQQGLASVAGVAAGNLGNAIGASIGLAALFSVSASAFIAVKWAGALYLIYLGVCAIRAARQQIRIVEPEAIPVRRVFRDGFIVALLNPKTAVFFGAFLPQFMVSAANVGLQGVLLGCIFVAIAATTDTLYALGASKASALLARSQTAQRYGRYLSGTTYIALGLFTALSGEPRKS